MTPVASHVHRTAAVPTQRNRIACLWMRIESSR